jgi:hypothetical protein
MGHLFTLTSRTMKNRILTLVVLGLLAAWTPPAEAQVNALTGRVTADVANTTQVYANVTGLTWYVAANTTYAFVCELSYTTNNADDGLWLSVNGPASPTALRYTVTTATNATAVNFVAPTGYDNATGNPTGSLGATAVPATIAGVIENGATAGTFAIRLRNEIASRTVTVLRGSSCTVYR